MAFESATAPSAEVEPLERETMRRVAWRLMPLLMLGYFCAYLDRSNVGMAATTMISYLGFNNAVFGFGAGLFFLGYFLGEIPSNLILNQGGSAALDRPHSDHLGYRRRLDGLRVERDEFLWQPHLARPGGSRLLPRRVAVPHLVVPVVLPHPHDGHLPVRQRDLALHRSADRRIAPEDAGVAGLQGWQWLYIIEGLPPVIMCFVIWNLLTDRPHDAAWLRPEQRTWLQSRLDSENSQRKSIRHYSLGQVWINPKLWLLTLAYVGQNGSSYGLVFFLPLIVKGLGVSSDWIGLVSALPYLCAFVAMIYWGYHSDLHGERTWHVAGAALVAAGGLAACVLIGAGHPVITMIALCVAMMGQQSLVPTFWSLPSAMLTGVAAAGGLAMINAVGNLGGWLGPTVYGLIKDATGSADIGLLCLAVGPLVTAIAVLIAGHDRRLERIPPKHVAAE